MRNKTLEEANFVYDHPLGPIYGWVSADGLEHLVLPRESKLCKPRMAPWAEGENIRLLRGLLASYFTGAHVDFGGIGLDLSRGTSFQQRVWSATRAIPWGETISYGELARWLGYKPGASRAVGQALGANPVPIVVPCHRVLASGGGLGGFSAGLSWKRTLLALEGHAWPTS